MAETTSQTPDEEWVQIKISIPRSIDDLLRARAARYHRSIAEEGRRFMQIGIAAGMATERETEHLETLLYRTAVAAAMTAEVERERLINNVATRIQREGRSPDDAERIVNAEWEQIRRKAVQSVTRALQQPIREDETDEDEDQQND